MTLVLSGTTGISGVAGSASTPALVGSDADSGYYINSANEPNASVNGTAVWSAASNFGYKNRIINGAMMIDQRNAGASVTITNASSTATNGYTLDRFYLRSETTTGSKVAVRQMNGVATGASNYEAGSSPTGFINSLRATSLSAYTLLSTEHAGVIQAIEGFNTADLAWGTASAATVTISFRVKSSLTGTFGGFVSNNDATRCYNFGYTINSANTWETKTITVPGDTSGAWYVDNQVGVYVGLSIGAGSGTTTTAGSWGSTLYRSVTGQVNVLGTNNATFYMTGLQFEKGSTATSFDFRDYSREFSLCCRYWQQFPNAISSSSGASAIPMWCSSASNASTRIFVPTVMRSPPSLSYAGTLATSGATGTIGVYYNGAFKALAVFNPNESTCESFRVDVSSSSSFSGGGAAGLYLYTSTQTDVRITMSAEL